MARSNQTKGTSQKGGRTAAVGAGPASAKGSKSASTPLSGATNVLPQGQTRTNLVLDIARKIHDGAGVMPQVDLQKLAKDLCDQATDYQDYNCPPPPAKSWWRP